MPPDAGLLESGGAGDDLGELGRDLGLASAVEDALVRLAHLARVLPDALAAARARKPASEITKA